MFLRTKETVFCLALVWAPRKLKIDERDFLTRLGTGFQKNLGDVSAMLKYRAVDSLVFRETRDRSPRLRRAFSMKLP